MGERAAVVAVDFGYSNNRVRCDARRGPRYSSTVPPVGGWFPSAEETGSRYLSRLARKTERGRGTSVGKVYNVH